MDNEYCEAYARIKRNNRKAFLRIAGGLAALAIGAKVGITHIDMAYGKEQNLLDKISNASTLLIIAASGFYTRREYKQLEKLDREYYGDQEYW